jgi:hypothetical protein
MSDKPNYFDAEEESAVHDAFLMIVSNNDTYEDIEDVIVEETSFEQEALDRTKERISE